MNDTDSNCQELNDIRYKTMFITGGINSNNVIEVNNEKNISVILDNELMKINRTMEQIK